MKYCDDYWKDVEQVVSCIPGYERLFSKTVLLTGATGLVVSAVVDLLSYLNKQNNAGIKLFLAGRSKERTLKRFEGSMEQGNFDFISFDATLDSELDVAADYIIHGAGNGDPARIMAEPADTLLGNVLGAKIMLEAAVRNQGSRILFISSSEVYGNGIDAPYKESDYGFVDILNPRAAYPLGKRAAETLCASYNKQYGVDFVVVRPGHIYGPGITSSDSRASAVFTRNAASGEKIVMKSAGTQLRSYCYALDCASGILSVLLNGQKGEAYNISNHESVVTIRQMAEALAIAGGTEVVVTEPTEAEKKSYNLMSNSSLDSTRLESLGWKGIFDLKKGVEASVKYY